MKFLYPALATVMFAGCTSQPSASTGADAASPSMNEEQTGVETTAGGSRARNAGTYVDGEKPGVPTPEAPPAPIPPATPDTPRPPG